MRRRRSRQPRAFDGPCHPGHSCRTDIEGHTGDAVVGTGNRYRGGCAAAAGLGIYDIDRVTEAAWVGVPSEWPGLGLDFSVDFWVLVPSFLFLGVIISIQVNGEAISMQRSPAGSHELSTSGECKGLWRAPA